MTDSFFQHDAFSAWVKKSVPWDGGNPPSKGHNEIADAAVWLAGEESGWVTGVALPVDGGFSLHIAGFGP